MLELENKVNPVPTELRQPKVDASVGKGALPQQLRQHAQQQGQKEESGIGSAASAIHSAAQQVQVAEEAPTGG